MFNLTRESVVTFIAELISGFLENINKNPHHVEHIRAVRVGIGVTIALC